MRLVEGSQAVFCGEPGDVPLVRPARSSTSPMRANQTLG
jgi:hypothetical protein